MSIVSNQSANIKRDREPGDRFGPRPPSITTPTTSPDDLLAQVTTSSKWNTRRSSRAAIAIWSPQSSVLEMPSCRHGVAAVKRSSPEVLKFCLSEVEPLDRLMRSLVMNAAIDLGQRSTAATPSARDDLRDDRYRGLLRCAAAEVQADRARQPA